MVIIFVLSLAGCTHHYAVQEATFWAEKAGAASTHQIHRQQQWVINPDSHIYLASTEIIGLDRSISSAALDQINNRVYQGFSEAFPRLAYSRRPQPLTDTLRRAQRQHCAYLVVPKLIYPGSPVKSSIYYINAKSSSSKPTPNLLPDSDPPAGRADLGLPLATQLSIYAVPSGEFLDAITVESRDGWMPTGQTAIQLIGDGIKSVGLQLSAQLSQRHR